MDEMYEVYGNEIIVIDEYDAMEYTLEIKR